MNKKEKIKLFLDECKKDKHYDKFLINKIANVLIPNTDKYYTVTNLLDLKEELYGVMILVELESSWSLEKNNNIYTAKVGNKIVTHRKSSMALLIALLEHLLEKEQ